MRVWKNVLRSRLALGLHACLQTRLGHFGKLCAYAGITGAIAAGVIYAFQLYSSPGFATADGGPLPEVVSYNRDVRPVLSQNCFRCHGQDAASRKVGLRLDIPEIAYGELAKNRGKHAIVPGNPDKSQLFRRVTASNIEDRMPPPDTHLVLSKRDIALLDRWIRQGARYERHWAYVPPVESKALPTPWGSRAINQVDRYIYANLARHGLSPSAEADRETLINRVAMDLTGLPPTLEEVDAFTDDKDSNAYEKLVDRLLRSRAYAERQANAWLDVARYADTDGFNNDAIGRLQYPYRDWVISAFQNNLPYDQFVTWQIAGDRLPNATREQVLATAFARAGKKSAEAGIIDEEYRVEYVNERTELVGKAILGLTVGCAKCHDHKYDVISQAEYYSFAGFFNSVDERGIADYVGWGPTLAWPSAQQSIQLATLRQEVERRRTELDSVLAAARAEAQSIAPGGASEAGGDAIEAHLREAQQAYYPFESAYKASFEPLTIANYPPNVSVSAVFSRFPGSFHGGGMAADLLEAAGAKATQSKRRLRPLPEDSLLIGLNEQQLVYSPDAIDPNAPGAINNVHFVEGPPGKGRAIMIDDTTAFANKKVGQFERTDPFTLDIWIKLRKDKPYSNVPVLYNSDQQSAGYELKLDNDVLSFNLRNTVPYDMLEVAMTAPLPRGEWVHVTATYDGSSKAAGMRLFINGETVQTEVLHDRLTRSIIPAPRPTLYGWYMGLSFGRRFGAAEFNKGSLDELRVFTRALTPVEVSYLHDPSSLAKFPPDIVRAQLSDVLLERDPRVMSARAALNEAVKAEQVEYTKVSQIDVLGDRLKERPTYVLDRGNFDQLLQQVPVQALTRVFPWKPEYPSNRLGLANWLFDPNNPLTARVYVNRLWQSHFGTGIVETAEDFGTQGSSPSNPELLDYLAVEFMRSGWDIRHVHKLIVMSATYRQSSTMMPESIEKDPRNIYLARGPRYRLSAEAIRDNALAASGLLVDRAGGDSVFPYQPTGVWESTGVGVQVYPDESLVPADEMHRRSLYTFVKRNSQPPAMAVFDLADRNVSSVSRRISTSPLQALVLLNDPQYVEAYRKLAERAIGSSADPDRQIVTLFRLATRRRPSDQELETLRRYRASQLSSLNTSPQDAEAILKIGVTASDTAADHVTLAAMTLAAAAIMNSPDAYSLR
jgi:mono/diheme cytochrome c family protein